MQERTCRIQHRHPRAKCQARRLVFRFRAAYHRPILLVARLRVYGHPALHRILSRLHPEREEHLLAAALLDGQPRSSPDSTRDTSLLQLLSGNTGKDGRHRAPLSHRSGQSVAAGYVLRHEQCHLARGAQSEQDSQACRRPLCPLRPSVRGELPQRAPRIVVCRPTLHHSQIPVRGCQECQQADSQ